MDTSQVLRTTIQQRHEDLARELGEVRERFRPGEADLVEPRHTRGMVDRLLADLSQHLNAANAVLVPVAKRRLIDGKQVVHDYLHAARELEVVVAHVKAHAYGSTYETKFSWDEAWAELEAALNEQRSVEEQVGERLAEELPDDDEATLAERLRSDERAEPTRPHPYSPHKGVLGMLTRKVMRRVDAFWDAAEGRMVRREDKHHKRPGLIGRYIMASPRIDED